MSRVFVVAESETQLKELIQAGRVLAERFETQLVAVIEKKERLIEICQRCGVDEIWLLLKDETTPFDLCVPVLGEALLEEQPAAVLVSSGPRGKDTAARLAVRLKAGLVSECRGIDFDEQTGKVIMKRLVFGGVGEQILEFNQGVVMATVARRTFAPAWEGESRTCPVRELHVPQGKVRIVERRKGKNGSTDLKNATRVVCVGRGFEKEEDLYLAKKLAGKIGAELACTRPVATELGWLPEDFCLGLSGQEVRPELYFGIGVSGQIQHITGIREAGIIVAVNKDENAPIFNYADYGVVGDLYQVLPLLLNLLEQQT